MTTKVAVAVATDAQSEPISDLIFAGALRVAVGAFSLLSLNERLFRLMLCGISLGHRKGIGFVKSSQVNAVIVGAANMSLPQSTIAVTEAEAETATATAALDNEQLK